MSDHTNIDDVLNHREETLVIDLLEHALSLDEDMSSALVDPEKGWYLPGEFEPRFKEGDLYYRKKDLVYDGNVINRHASPFISNFESIPKIIDDIFNSEMDLVVKAADMRRYSRYFKRQPTIPAVAVKAAVGIIQAMMSRMCPHSGITYNRYRLDYLVKPEKHELIHSDEYMHAFERLLDEIQNFIGKHTWNLYHFRMKGSTMILDKGYDARIYFYYRDKFEKEDQERLKD